MTVNYTTNLSLGQPVTGTESGTWGDDVNNSVTSYLDIAIAGGLAITITTTDVTLSITQGTSSATNIGSTTAQYAILNVSGAMTAARNLILPSSSRQYVINNNTTGGFALTVKGSATSGVTMVNGEKAHVFWNGSDYAKVSNSSGAGVFSSITNSGLTSGRVVYSTTGGLETDSANLTFNGTTLTANTIGAFTLGGTIAGGGNQINNVIIGTSTPLAGSFTTLTASTSITNSSLTAGRVVYTTTGGLEAASAGLTFDGTNFATTGTASAAKLIPTGSSATGNGLYLPAANSVGISTNGTNAVYIDSTQNVGIGTNSPSSKLEVYDATTAIARVTAGTEIFEIRNTGSEVRLAVVSADPLTFRTSNVEAMRIDSSGNVLVTSAAGLGYGTGSGGTVTQATSRTTGVTLSKPTGAITMFSAAGSVVAATFTVTNTLVAATDTIILNQKSGTNLYILLVTAVAAGSFNITFYTTGGVATDAPVINFAIIKGVTA